MTLELHDSRNKQDLDVPPTTKEVWDTISETYFKVKDVVQTYDLTVKMWSISKGISYLVNIPNILKN